MKQIYAPLWSLEKIQAALECRIKTPFYFFDADMFVENIKLLRNILPASTRICYAVKANTWLLPYADKYVDYIEICSPGELKIAQALNICPDKITIDGVCRTNDDLMNLASIPFHRIVVESIRQAEILNYYAGKNNCIKDILIRLSNGNQFGMSLEDIEYLTMNAKNFPALNIRGIHAYWGTQKKNPEELQKNFDIIKNAASRFEIFREIEFGPGLAVIQSPAQKFSNFNECLEIICKNFYDFSRNYITVIECGRLLSANTGIYVTTMIERKVIDHKIFYIVDGGRNHLVYDGMFYGQPAPFIIIQPGNTAEKKELVSVCGALCAESDILAKNVELNIMNDGEKLVFMSAGAYGVTEGAALLLSRPLPAVLCKNNGNINFLREHKQTWPLNFALNLGENRMTYNEILKGVTDCIISCIKETVDNIPDNFEITEVSVLSDDLGINSLDKIRLQVKIEDRFLFSFDPFDDFDQIFETVKSICDYIFALKAR